MSRFVGDEDEARTILEDLNKDNPSGRSVVPGSGAGDNPGNGAEPVSTEEFRPSDPRESHLRGGDGRRLVGP